MSISTHINKYNSISNFLLEVSAYDGTDTEAVEKFLRGIYPDDSCDYDYDMDKGLDDPQFTIKVIDNSMDEYVEENYLTINLPSRKEADELASMLNGTVTFDSTEKPKANKSKKRKTLYIVSVARYTKNARSLIAANDKNVKLWVLPPTVHHTLEDAQKYFNAFVKSYSKQTTFVNAYNVGEPDDPQYTVIELTDQICIVRLTDDTPED